MTEPLTKFAKLTGKDSDLETHSQLKYHVEASTNAKLFLATRDNRELEVINQLSKDKTSSQIEWKTLEKTQTVLYL